LKFALVTGASKGVGKGIALELAREGFAIAVNYNRDRAGAESTVEEIRAAGGDADAFQADVGVSGDVARMFEAYDARFPKIDCLVNNAGIQTWSTLLDLKEEDWDRVIATNLKGTFLCTQQAGRRMKDSGGGTIVNIGSGCNKWPFPRLVDYTASKGGIERWNWGATRSA
jgi:NAD(P)-dependent dehydrogenase (short-subunit alcohol dehydrogenase family)